jgi:hypothetical protein
MNRSANGFFAFVRFDGGFFLRCFLLGLPPLLLIGYGLLGSLQSLARLLVVSVVCTLGIGAFFWFGLAMLMGFVLQVLVPPLRGAPPVVSGAGSRSVETLLKGTSRSAGPVLGPAQRPAASAWSQDPLGSFIRARRMAGEGEQALRRDLRRAGWSEEQVAAALEQAGGGMAVVQAGGGQEADGP